MTAADITPAAQAGTRALGPGPGILMALAAAARRLAGAVAARHAAMRDAAMLAALDHHMRADIGLPPRVSGPRPSSFWLV